MPAKGLILSAVFAVLVLASTAPAGATGARGLTVPLKASERAGARVVEEVELYSNSYALVIGIDNYTGGWPKLRMAVKDARAVANGLRRKGFQVTLKTDLTSDRLSKTLKRFFAITGRDPDARLFLWYAGHGHTIEGEGFLVPADAPIASDPTFLVSALPMRDFGSLVRLARAKHVMSVFDSCFSGTIFRTRASSPPRAITEKTTKPVRQFVTSGDAGQEVRDDGSFRELFLRAIRGDERADFNGDGYVTGAELGLFLSQSMTDLTASAQTPKSGKLHDVRYNQGDFVFALPQGAAPAAKVRPLARAPATPSVDRDSLFWQSIQNSTDAKAFEAYIAQFPNGVFATLARMKLAALQEKKVQLNLWAGEWRTGFGMMRLTIKDRTVTGTYEWDQGRIKGRVSADGRSLTGTWREHPSYNAPDDGGAIELRLTESGDDFTGRWWFGDDTGGAPPAGNKWNGRRVR